jgi:hypothetical protein
MTSELSSVVCELVMIVVEDRPRSSDLAMVDDLTETVTELQGAVAEASEAISGVPDPRNLPETLPPVADALQAAQLRYWRDLRSYECIAELRRAARGRGSEWASWHRSVEASAQRCEQPLARAASALSAGWQEIAELLTLYLPAVSSAPEPATPPSPTI